MTASPVALRVELATDATVARFFSCALLLRSSPLPFPLLSSPAAVRGVGFAVLPLLPVSCIDLARAGVVRDAADGGVAAPRPDCCCSDAGCETALWGTGCFAGAGAAAAAAAAAAAVCGDGCAALMAAPALAAEDGLRGDGVADDDDDDDDDDAAAANSSELDNGCLREVPPKPCLKMLTRSACCARASESTLAWRHRLRTSPTGGKLSSRRSASFSPTCSMK